MTLQSCFADCARTAHDTRTALCRLADHLDNLALSAILDARRVLDLTTRLPDLAAGDPGPSSMALAYAGAGAAGRAAALLGDRQIRALEALAEEARAEARTVAGLAELLPLPVAEEEMDCPQEEPVHYAPPEAAAAECEGVPACTGTRDCPVCGELPAGSLGVEDLEDDPTPPYVLNDEDAARSCPEARWEASLPDPLMRPLTPEEAEAAYDAAEPVPLSKDHIQEIVRSCVANGSAQPADTPALVHVPQVVADAADKDPVQQLIEPPGKKRPRGRRKKGT
jgi:hypothetical protein